MHGYKRFGDLGMGERFRFHHLNPYWWEVVGLRAAVRVSGGERVGNFDNIDSDKHVYAGGDEAPAPTDEEIREGITILAGDEEILFMDGYDDCLMMRVGRRFDSPCLAVYDTARVIEKLMADGMTRNEAWEYFEFNQIGAWVGERTPLFI